MGEVPPNDTGKRTLQVRYHRRNEMEAVVLAGLPGSGKSSFYREHFFRTHVRISLDLLKTRHRETRFLETCVETAQSFLIDNTNSTRAERSKYIEAMKATRVPKSSVGYYFESKVEDCLRRNAGRSDDERVPDMAILTIAKKLERPSFDEGFDQLFYVRLTEQGFLVEEWNDEI